MLCEHASRPRRAGDAINTAAADTASVDGKSKHTGGSDVVQLWSSRCEVLARSNRHDAACNVTGGRFVKEAPAPCLLTGLGRSGTSYTSHLLHSLGWEINHDNKDDFCPCPGKDGSVAHTYAFADTRRCYCPHHPTPLYIIFCSFYVFSPCKCIGVGHQAAPALAGAEVCVRSSINPQPFPFPLPERDRLACRHVHCAL